MSRVSFNRKRVKLKQLLGLRARLALLTLILVAPLMLERARSLEDARSKQIALASAELANTAKHSVDTQREVILSVETLLKTAAYIRSSAGGMSLTCDLLRASLPVNLPWIRNLLILDRDGRVQCSTNNALVGLDMSDRDYFTKTQASRGFVFSNFLISKADQKPLIIAAYPVSAIDEKSDAMLVAAVDLDWMSKLMANLGGRPGITAVLVDSAGTVLAAPPDQASMIGRSLDNMPQLSAVADMATKSNKPEGSLSFAAADGSKRIMSFSRIAGTGSSLVVGIDEAKVSVAIDRDIRTAYVQLAFVCVLVLLGALIAAEKLIIQPIDMMASTAKRFGQGDWSARAARRLPAEFVPLSRALNGMAAQLGQRERELVAHNDHLTVMASIDMLSGLANRRGFQSRLDFEWLKGEQYAAELSLLMIDVDHFKLYNDTYGHPEGDACLSRLGETLARIAVQTAGFAGRYGGEEFCLLLPNTSSRRAIEIGEMVREAVQSLGIAHLTSSHQRVTVSVGVACTTPNEVQQPVDLIEAADAALYAAKHRGRNTVVGHGFVRSTDDGSVAIAS
jgi:diguanylate cyclase (GGDEF)-like protein